MLITGLKHALSVSARVIAYELSFRQRGKRGGDGTGGKGERIGAILAVLRKSRRREEVQDGGSQNTGASKGSHSRCGEIPKKQSSRRKSKQGRKRI